jgi:hypothetical protein
VTVPQRDLAGSVNGRCRLWFYSVGDLADQLRLAELEAQRKGIDLRSSTHWAAVERRVREMESRLYGRPDLAEH